MRVEIGYKPKLTFAELEAMNTYDLIRDERDFKIVVGERTFFHEPLFPVLELVRYCLEWRKNANSSFVYNTIESEENPLLSFAPQNDTWRVFSVWQKFECETEFSLAEVQAFVESIVNQVIKP